MRRLLILLAMLLPAAGLAGWMCAHPAEPHAIAAPAPAPPAPSAAAAEQPASAADPPAVAPAAPAGEASTPPSAPEPAAMPDGLRLLLEKAYLPSDFDQETFDAVWQVWPEPLRAQAEAATPDERRRMAYERYGLDERPGDPLHRPLQYVVDDAGNWTMNCLACHGGSVEGLVWPGLPNTHYALATLTEEIRAVKLELSKRMARMDVGSLFVPLGDSRGATNAVMFGVVLMNYRDAELNIYPNRLPPRLVNHDMDAPPWWNVSRKQRLYIDGFATKSHRALMPFLLVQENGPEKFSQWEEDFRTIYEWLDTLEPPPYSDAIDAEIAARGELVFNDNCARCHGTYGPGGSYPERDVPLAELGTDPVRLTALSTRHRENYAASWFTRYGEETTNAEPAGYVAPPLDGIWASAPYLHNGSVPTLWHLLHPAERPVVWRRSGERSQEYDHERMGLAVETFLELPEDVESGIERREFFDTRHFGKSAAGHTFPDVLTDDEKAAVLEYLKTL